MKGIYRYIKLITEPTIAWNDLAKNPKSSNVRIAYLFMLCMIPFSMIGQLIALVEIDWNILISNALVASVSLLLSLHIATVLCKVYYEKITSKNISYSDCSHYVASASAAIYTTVWLVEITQMPVFWLCSLYTLKIVLESIQTHYLVVDEDKKYTFIWMISTLLIASPFMVQYILGIMIKG